MLFGESCILHVADMKFLRVRQKFPRKSAAFLLTLHRAFAISRRRFAPVPPLLLLFLAIATRSMEFAGSSATLASRFHRFALSPRVCRFISSLVTRIVSFSCETRAMRHDTIERESSAISNRPSLPRRRRRQRRDFACVNARP